MSVKKNKEVAKKIGCWMAGLIFSGALCAALALLLDEKFPKYVEVRKYDRDGNVEGNRYIRKKRFCWRK